MTIQGGTEEIIGHLCLFSNEPKRQPVCVCVSMPLYRFPVFIFCPLPSPISSIVNRIRKFEKGNVK